MAEFKCMLCGNWHEDGSKILNRHIHEYYQGGGTIELSRWERRDSNLSQSETITESFNETHLTVYAVGLLIAERVMGTK